MWNPFKRTPKSLRGTVLYDHVYGRRFDPGAPAEGFEPAFTNPVILFRGPGRVAGQLHPLQPPAVELGPQIGVQGLGGVQVGQYFAQPLIDPSQLED